MPQQVCPQCDNAGVIFTQVRRDKKKPDGTTVTETEEVEVKCPKCKGRGWIDG
ncbi:hypothetical protein [Embleya scabrispora]|uniref:hypothetical protein n=1 Tax=Embleya scabrispora TaxID=159449 RepID=UPI00137527D1|nr:hypothetical protein [Embleya scabrispora]